MTCLRTLLSLFQLSTSMLTLRVYTLGDEFLLFRKLDSASDAFPEESYSEERQESDFLDKEFNDFPARHRSVGGGVSLISVTSIAVGILFVILLIGAMRWRKKRQRSQAKQAYSGQHIAMLQNGTTPQMPELPVFHSSNHSNEVTSATTMISNFLHGTAEKNTPQGYLGPSGDKYDAMGDFDQQSCGQRFGTNSVCGYPMNEKLISIQKFSPIVTLSPAPVMTIESEQQIDDSVRKTKSTMKQLAAVPSIDANFCDLTEKNTVSAVFMRSSEDDEEIAI